MKSNYYLNKNIFPLKKVIIINFKK